MKKKENPNFLKKMFMDDNDINEKSVVGFGAFIMMVICLGVDIWTGFHGQEMPINDTFDGLNKPESIVELKKPDGLTFKEDTNIRAGNRHIMLSVCEKGNSEKYKLKKFDKFKELLIHELTHTMCNHVTYRRQGNHLEDFENYEKFLTYFVNECPKLKDDFDNLKKMF